MSLLCGQLNYASFREAIVAVWSSFKISMVDASFIPFLNSSLHSHWDDFNLFTEMFFIFFYFLIYVHLIIPNTFGSDSRNICCQETYKEQCMEADRRLSSVGGVVCHSWLGPEEGFFLTHLFIYLLCLN